MTDSIPGREFLVKADIERIRLATLGKVCKNACKGSGILFKDQLFSDCECVKTFHQRVTYLTAGILPKHWEFTPKNLLKAFEKENEVALKIVKMYCENLEKVVEKGVGLYIQGHSGLAKSALGCYVLKEALKKEIPCYNIRMSELTKLIFESLQDNDRREFLRWLQKEVCLLMIDEIDKDYKIGNVSTFSGTQVNEFFGAIYNRGISLIVTSNISKKDLSRVHAENVVDRLSELADVVLIGQSYRKPDIALKQILGIEA